MTVLGTGPTELGDTAIRSAYMSNRHVKSPPPLFLSFFPDLFSCSTATAGFLPPRPPYGRRPARADAVKAGRFFSGHHPWRPWPLQQSSTTAGLSYEVHGTCDIRINLYPAAPIRLAKVLLAWTIAQEGWGSSFRRQIGKRRSAMPTYSHTSNPPDTPDWGGRNSAQCRRYRVRVAPCGTRPCSR